MQDFQTMEVTRKFAEGQNIRQLKAWKRIKLQSKDHLFSYRDVSYRTEKASRQKAN